MTRLPILHPNTLCRSGGDTCGDYVDDGRGGCRYFGTTAARDTDGAFAVPVCALAWADAERQDAEIGDALGFAGQYAGRVAVKALLRLEKRARLMRLNEHLDHDAYADTRPPVEPEEEPEPVARGTGNTARVAAALGAGLTRVVYIARALGMRPGHVSSLLSHMKNRGHVRRIDRGHWVLTGVQFDQEAS